MANISPLWRCYLFSERAAIRWVEQILRAEGMGEIAATGAHEIAATGAHEIAATGAHEIAATGADAHSLTLTVFSHQSLRPSVN